VRAAAGDHAATLLLCCSRALASSFGVASRSSAPGRCAGYGAGWRTMRTRAELILGMTQSIGIAGVIGGMHPLSHVIAVSLSSGAGAAVVVVAIDA
jgi:hypothetical protein